MILCLQSEGPIEVPLHCKAGARSVNLDLRPQKLFSSLPGWILVESLKAHLCLSERDEKQLTGEHH